jgi:hypothetical protein
VKGLVIAKKIGVEWATFRKHYAPTLKRFGVRNEGDGYYLSGGSSEAQ